MEQALQTAYDQGVAARKKRRRKRTNPYKDAMARGVTESELTALYNAWASGWAAGKGSRPARNYAGSPVEIEPDPLPQIETRPAVGLQKRAETAPKPAETGPKSLGKDVSGVFWPEDEPLPVAMPRRPRRPVVPCRECRLLFVRGGGQAVYIRSSDRLNAYCKCRACGARFFMPFGPEVRA